MKHLAQISIPSTFGSPFGQARNLGDLVSAIIFTAMFISGLVLLVLLIFGGISIIAGAGRGDSEATGRGKAAATSAVIGFLIIFVAYWIIQIVELITGLNLLNIGI